MKILEGGGVYAAERDGRSWLIVDWGTLADLLDPVEDAAALEELVVVIEFDSPAERKAYADGELRNSPGGSDEIMETEL